MRLNILWTSGDPDTFFKMVAMYALNAPKRGWWEEVSIIIWGGSARLAGEHAAVQRRLRELAEAGIEIRACRACAEQLGVAEILEKLGIEVDYMGEPLTELLKSDAKLLTV
jgi:hypothetical protein